MTLPPCGQSAESQADASLFCGSEHTQLYSRQGTGDTAEEAASEREHPHKLWSSASEPRAAAADIPPSYSRATGLDSVGDADGRRLRIQTPDEKSGCHSQSLLSTSHQLTASELLRSR